MTDVSRALREGTLNRKEETRTCGRWAMRRPEDTNVWLMMNLVGMSTSGGNLVMDFCVGIWSTENVCILPDQQRQFVECELDSDVLNLAGPSIFLTFTSRMLNLTFDNTRGEKMRKAARKLEDKVAVVWAGRRATAGEVAFGMDATQVMPEYVLHFLSTLYQEYRQCKKCCCILLRMSFSK